VSTTWKIDECITALFFAARSSNQDVLVQRFVCLRRKKGRGLKRDLGQVLAGWISDRTKLLQSHVIDDLSECGSMAKGIEARILGQSK
jgi:hypothetical protein